MIVVSSVIMHEALEFAGFSVLFNNPSLYLRQACIELIYSLVPITSEVKPLLITWFITLSRHDNIVVPT